jgi:twinkle protein
VSTPDATPEEIERFTRSHLIVHKVVDESSGPHAVADCLAAGCPNPKKHLYVNQINGLWDCKRCDASGNLWTLADLAGVRIRAKSLITSAASVLMAGFQDLEDKSKDKQPQPIRNAKGLDMAKVQQACDRLWADDIGAQVLAYLNERGFDETTIRHFMLCVSWIGKEPAVGIPYLEGGKVPLMKMRNLARDKAGRKFMRTKGSHSGLFNVDGIQGCDQVVLVEGELDAISLWQMGITNVASTSLGAKKELTTSWMLALASAKDVVIWYDADEAGDEATAGLIRQLGSYRCRIARIPDQWDAKDANDLLRQGATRSDVRAILDAAKPIDNTAITTPMAYQDAVMGDIQLGQEALGLPSGWHSLDKLIRGWRPKELTVVSGHTGHGKSTWLFNAAFALAQQGIPVLMSAFENGPESIARKVFRKAFGRAPSDIRTEQERDEALEAARQLDTDPVYILDFYGRKKHQTIMDAITYAVHRLGVRHVMLDHLHFFLSRPANVDEREWIDQVMMDLVALTRDLDIHIWLVAHPRGSVPLEVIPTGDSLKGSSTIKQVADLGITVYRSIDMMADPNNGSKKIRDATGRKVDVEMGPEDSLIYVWKARHDDAREGSALFGFRRGDLSYSDHALKLNREQATSWHDASDRWGDNDDPFPF